MSQVIARDPRLSAVLSAAPPHSHCWNPYGWGLENGMVFLGGGFPNPAVAREVMELQIASGALEQFMGTEGFHPASAAGRRVVTVHGDFNATNILRSESGDLVPIDLEFTCAAAAGLELGFLLIAFLGAQVQPATVQ